VCKGVYARFYIIINYGAIFFAVLAKVLKVRYAQDNNMKATDYNPILVILSKGGAFNLITSYLNVLRSDVKFKLKDSGGLFLNQLCK
jgi:hypothetical protein